MGKEYQRNIAILGFIDFGPSILLNDDFEGNLSWENATTGSGTLALDTSILFRGTQSMLAQTSSGTTLDNAIAEHDLAQRPLGPVRFNASFYVTGAVTQKLIGFRFRRYDGTNLHDFYIYWDDGSSGWFYLDSTNNPIRITSLSDLSEDVWHSIEIVMDQQNDEFISISIDDEIVDMSGISCYVPASASNRESKITLSNIKAASGGAEQLSTYYDDVVLMRI